MELLKISQLPENTREDFTGLLKKHHMTVETHLIDEEVFLKVYSFDLHRIKELAQRNDVNIKVIDF